MTLDRNDLQRVQGLRVEEESRRREEETRARLAQGHRLDDQPRQGTLGGFVARIRRAFRR